MPGFRRNGRLMLNPTTLFLILIITLLVYLSSSPTTTTVQGDISFINAERRQLMKDSLVWLYLKRKGKVLSPKQVEDEFLETVLEKYRTSPFYRTFVIAFQNGVYKKAYNKDSMNYKWGGQIGAGCRSAYPLRYKNPWNHSVTWHYQKEFTFKEYRNRNVNYPVKYGEFICDFRKGLQCKKQSYGSSWACQCPTGSTPTPILDPAWDTSWTFCSLDHKEVCSLIDLDHGNDPKHSLLRSQLHKMIFNLEKPLSCCKDCQCRFHPNDLSVPRCYKETDGPFYTPPTNPANPDTPWIRKLGESCAVGLYADTGMCEENKGQYGQPPGLVCYNYPKEPPKSPPRPPPPDKDENRTGFCAHEYGQYGMASVRTFENGQLNIQPMFMTYIYPYTVKKLRGQRLYNFYKNFLDKVHFPFFVGGVQANEVGDACEHAKSEKMRALWEVFMNVKSNVSVTFLENTLQQVIDLASIEPQKRVCKTYKYYHRNFPSSSSDVSTNFSALYCDKDNVINDGKGNNGICVPSRRFNGLTDEYALELHQFLDNTSKAIEDERYEDTRYNVDILLKHPESECTKSDSLVARSRPLPGDVLQDGGCPKEYVCYKTYSEVHVTYSGGCNLAPLNQKQKMLCHDTVVRPVYDKCEKASLNAEIGKAMSKVINMSTLELGQKCNFRLEWDLRNWVRDGTSSDSNLYHLMAGLDPRSKAGAGVKFCDATKLLECKREGVCQCVGRTSTRWGVFKGNTYLSAHCYLTDGYCAEQRDVSEMLPVTKGEQEEMWQHYGNATNDHCSIGGTKDDQGNLCAFIIQKTGKCTNGKDKEEEVDYGDENENLAGRLRSIRIFSGWSLIVYFFIWLNG